MSERRGATFPVENSGNSGIEQILECSPTTVYCEEVATTMGKDLDQIAQEIQKAVLDDARRIYSEKVIDHFLHPRNVGGIKGPDGFAWVKGSCGDTMYIYLRIDGRRIADAKFMTDGCGTTIACGSVVTEMAKGKGIREASRIRDSRILEAIDGLPEADAHCAGLAASTLRAAIKSYRMAERSKKRDDSEFQNR
jgi:nitrogen fixation NifU-like protein